ncbi:hypothetical protein C8R45DRAFT_942593 [Mycena sanguinolenta]|nr:hypothetical protein C8R45DRAFT_942593 [Mycena sanguinolenta]
MFGRTNLNARLLGTLHHHAGWREQQSRQNQLLEPRNHDDESARAVPGNAGHSGPDQQMEAKIDRKISISRRLPVEIMGEQCRGWSLTLKKLSSPRRNLHRGKVRFEIRYKFNLNLARDARSSRLRTKPRDRMVRSVVPRKIGIQLLPRDVLESTRTEHAGRGAQRQIRRKIFDRGVQKAWPREDQGDKAIRGLDVA